jgi:hypothetical protein
MKLRRQDWPQRLAEYLKERRSTPFQWGTNDCLVYACDAVERMTDEDPLEDIRGTWSNEFGARRVVVEMDGLPRWIGDRFRRLRSVLEAQDGDIGILAESDDWNTVLLCVGAYWAGPSPAGMVMLPINDPQVIAAFAVGR